MGASKTRSARHLVGVISDTHGLVRPAALDHLRGSDLIVHCGDIGEAAVLDTLKAIAPVSAVRGNNDKRPWATALPTADGGPLIWRRNRGQTARSGGSDDEHSVQPHHRPQP